MECLAARVVELDITVFAVRVFVAVKLFLQLAQNSCGKVGARNCL